MTPLEAAKIFAQYGWDSSETALDVLQTNRKGTDNRVQTTLRILLSRVEELEAKEREVLKDLTEKSEALRDSIKKNQGVGAIGPWFQFKLALERAREVL